MCRAIVAKKWIKLAIEAQMSRQRTLLLTAFLGLLILLMGGAPILKGAFYVGKHEGDTMHLAELVLRMADGQ